MSFQFLLVFAIFYTTCFVIFFDINVQDKRYNKYKNYKTKRYISYYSYKNGKF